MAWWTRNKGSISGIDEKLNPVQPDIVGLYGGPTHSSMEYPASYTGYYERLEVVNRAVNMIVDDVSEIPFRVGDAVKGLTPLVKGIRKSRVELLLNDEPNPYQDISTFRRNCVTDLLLDGNIFIYFDGWGLYHLPAAAVTVVASDSTYVDHFEFNNNGKKKFRPDEVIWIKDNSFRSIYRGTSRLRPATDSLQLLTSMKSFQKNFFQNGAVLGLVITSPNTLSERIKERMILSWMTKYSPTGGGRRPLILDGGLDVKSTNEIKFKDLDFQTGYESSEKVVLKALGVPPILLDAGNNANLRPNHRLYYLETVTPIIRKYNSAFERFFGFSVVEDVTDIPALQPELTDQAKYYTALVNTGVITPNEAREKLGYESIPGHDDLRIPENIAGSAVDPSEGGRPEDDEE